MTEGLTTRPSPSATRAVGIINFLAEHPNQAFKLSDLQRALRLSRTTCHSILLALLEAGYVHRGADKSYTLGPALVEIGRAANTSLSPLQIAQPEMRRLADRYDVICSAVFAEGGDMVVRDRAASVSHLGFSAPRGIRLPMISDPSSALQFAWATPAQFEAWFDQLKPLPTAAERGRMEQAIQFARDNRYSFAFVDSGGNAGAQGGWRRDEAGRLIRHHAIALDDAETYQIAVLQSWVFDTKGRIAFALTLTGMTHPLPGSEVRRRAEELRDACDRITNSIGGRWPQLWEHQAFLRAPDC